MTDESNSNRSLQLQERVDFYSVALAFTILGLSVQTFVTGHGYASDAAELLGWACLMGSGLAGLHRLSWQPQIFRLYEERDEKQGWLKETNKLIDQRYGEVFVSGTQDRIAVTKIKENLEKAIANYTKAAEKLNDDHAIRYRWQKGFLVAGLASLMVARGLPVLVNLFGYRLSGASK